MEKGVGCWGGGGGGGVGGKVRNALHGVRGDDFPFLSHSQQVKTCLFLNEAHNSHKK